ncbi:hypothetical protein BMS3Abin03_00788 [bacterium BMS3Abin03]|nr:hypothetical protein BMS3Abin03_00788 [bacterium BMS3Abin03]
MSQFIDLISNDKIEDLYIISPFFDKQSQALKELEKMTQAKNINVAIQPETVSLNYKTIPQSIKYNYYKYSSDKRYLHAKIYLANGKKHSHILIGSANCSNQGLGNNITKRTNVEACIYSRITDSTYFASSLGLSKIFSKNNKLNRDNLKKITFKEIIHVRKSADIKLFYLEYNRGNFSAYINNNNKINKYTLVLEGNSSKKTVKLKSYLVKGNHVSFKAHDIDFNTYFTGYLISPNKKISNRVLISYYQLLEENAPSPRATQFYEIIEKINLEDSDFTDLIAPFEKLIFYTPSKLVGFNFRKKNIKEEESDKDSAAAEYISYDEFLNKSRTFNNKKSINSLNDNSSIVLLMDFLLSKIGIFKPGKNLLNQQTESFDPKLYEEEKSDDFLWTKPDKYYYYSKQKHIKTIGLSEAKYLKSKTLHLAKRYISYLNQIIKGIPTENLIAPKYLDAIELTKFFSISLLMNYFAGKEYKIGEDVIEVLELDGTKDKSYWNLVLNIIARVFCYQDTKLDHQCVLRKLRIESTVNNRSEDFIAALSLAAFNICFIWEYFREKEWPELEILAFKFYLNTKIYIELLNQNKIKFYFEKYYENSGFKNKRDILTQKHVIKLSAIIKRYEILSVRVSKIAEKLEGIEDHFLNGKGKFPIITQPCVVWNPRFGLSYAYEVNPPSVYLSEWGFEKERVGFKSSFVLKVDIES